MKVRHKFEQTEFDLVEASEHFYIVSSPSTYRFVVPKTDFVLIPTDRWQDVTGECRADDNGCVLHHDGEETLQIWIPVLRHGFGGRYAYRLRKVQVPNHGSGMSSYFLVERKVEGGGKGYCQEDQP